MFLSRVEINVYRRETRKAMNDPQMMHAAVMASFPSMSPGSDSDRVLWRMDTLGPSTYIIVQSSRKPDFTHIVEQFGWPESNQKWDSLDYDGLLSRLENNQRWRFRLVANPVRSVPSGDGTRGKVRPCLSVSDQLSWLVKRSSKNGFSIESEGTGAMIKSRETKEFKRGDSRITLTYAAYEGVLEITDVESFKTMLINGMGKEKAYGCGLLTLAK